MIADETRILRPASALLEWCADRWAVRKNPAPNRMSRAQRRRRPHVGRRTSSKQQASCPLSRPKLLGAFPCAPRFGRCRQATADRGLKGWRAGRPAKAIACRLLCDACHTRQFARNKCPTIHQGMQHADASRITSQRGPGDVLIHALEYLAERDDPVLDLPLDIRTVSFICLSF